jgi:hypothetical protein
MPKIEQRKTFIISHNMILNDQSVAIDFSTMNFHPDAMIVRGIAFRDSGGGTMLVGSMKCDFLADPLFSFATTGVLNNVVTVNFENTYPIHEINLHGIHTFTTFDSFGAGSQLIGLLSVHLEFVKYKHK